MAKQTVDAQTTALQALARAIADPEPKALLGSAKAPGFFQGSSKAVKEAAKLCEDRQWLMPTGDWAGTGRGRRPKYRLSPAGVQAVLQHSDALLLVRGLAAGLQEQVQLLAALQGQVGRLLADRQPLAEAVSKLASKLEPPDVDGILRRLAPAPPPVAAESPGWHGEVIRQVTAQRERDRYQPLSLPDLYAALRPAYTGLTLGQFHDGLRLLRDKGQIRLTPFTRALATIDDPRNALFLDGEVMYYVELP